MPNRLKEYKSGEEIPLEFEQAIKQIGWKTDFIFKDKYGHSGVLEHFSDVNLMSDRNHVNLRTLASMSVQLVGGGNVIACYCENPAGEGTITYSECTREKAEQCMKVMTPSRSSSASSLADFIVAHDIPIRFSFFGSPKTLEFIPKNLLNDGEKK